MGLITPPISVRPEDHSAVLAAIECSDDREIITSFLEELHVSGNDVGSDGYLPPLRPGEYYADLTFEQLLEWANQTSASGTRGNRDTPPDVDNHVLIRSERDLHAFVETMETVREVAKSNIPKPIGRADFNQYSATQIRELNAVTATTRLLMLNVMRICGAMILGLKKDLEELRHLKVASVEGKMFVRRKKLISVHYLKVPVMIFDATLRPDLLAHSFEQIDVSYIRRAKDGDGVTRYQLRDSDLPYSTLKGSDWPARLSVLAGLFERAYGRTGLIGPKFICEQISSDLPGEVASGHFGALRGLNSFENVRALVVTSRPAIAPIEAEDRAAVLTEQPIKAIQRDKRWYPSEDAYVLWRNDPRAGWKMNSARHPDPIVDAVRAAVTDDGLEQALGRGRNVRRRADNPLVEYLLTSTPTTRPVDGTFTLGQLKAATSFVGVLLMSGIWFAGGSKGFGGVLHLFVQAIASQRPDSLYIHLIGNPAFEGPEPAADWLKKQRDDNPEIGLLCDDIDKALAQRAHTVGILHAPFPIADFQPLRAKVRGSRYFAQLYVRTLHGQTPQDALRALIGPLVADVEIKTD